MRWIRGPLPTSWGNQGTAKTRWPRYTGRAITERTFCRWPTFLPYPTEQAVQSDTVHTMSPQPRGGHWDPCFPSKSPHPFHCQKENRIKIGQYTHPKKFPFFSAFFFHFFFVLLPQSVIALRRVPSYHPLLPVLLSRTLFLRLHKRCWFLVWCGFDIWDW
jgi:hypothetical protein